MNRRARPVLLALFVAPTLLPVPGIAQDKTGRVKARMPWLPGPGTMWIDGIEGESRAEGHDTWIDFTSVDWGRGETPPAAGLGGGAIVITRRPDGSSPKIVGKIAEGAVLPHLVLHLRGEDESTQQVMDLQSVRITSYSINASGDPPIERIAISYERIEARDDMPLKGKKILEN